MCFLFASLSKEVGLFTCQFNGKMYGEMGLFDAEVNGCAKCICVETKVYCNRSKCPISTELPSKMPIVPSNPHSIDTNTEIDDMTAYDPNQEVENLNTESEEELLYRPNQFGLRTNQNRGNG